MRCTIHDNGSWKTEVVACLAPSGIKIPINSSLDDGNDQWKCSMNERGMVTLVQGANPNAKCDGHEVGSRWQEKSFELECAPGNTKFSLGTLAVINNFRWHSKAPILCH